jgi:hypothetical protein
VNGPDLMRACQPLVDMADAHGVLAWDLEIPIQFWSDPDTVIDLPVELDPLDVAIWQTDAASCSR